MKQHGSDQSFLLTSSVTALRGAKRRCLMMVGLHLAALLGPALANAVLLAGIDMQFEVCMGPMTPLQRVLCSNGSDSSWQQFCNFYPTLGIGLPSQQGGLFMPAH